jgi:hypothetical protein
MHKPVNEPSIYGVLAEFSSQADLIHAAEKVRDEGYKVTDAFSPYPIEGLLDALGKKESRIPWFILACGLTGFCAAWGLQTFTSNIDYPWNIGGRPLFSWPAFLPIVFELTVLLSAFGAVFGMIGFNGLPLPYHPLFNIEAFKKASRDGFFLVVEATDPKFDRSKTAQFLKALKARGVYEVEP